MISIIVTAYNCAKWIEKAVRSALGQTAGMSCDLEVLVVEDCSTDNTLEVLEGIEDKRLRIVRNAENVGAGMSRRRGVEECRGAWVLFLDGDDWLEPRFVERLLEGAEESGADIVSGGVTIREPSGYYEIQCYGDCVTEGYEKIVKYWGQKIVFMNNRLIRKSLFEKVPYSHRRYIEDTSTIIPMLWYANKVVYVDEVGYNYRVNPKSLTHTSNFVKEFVFKGLCWCDLVEFFNEKDPGLYARLDIRSYVRTIISQLNEHRFTADEVAEYKEEYAELMRRLWNLVGINGIEYKQVKK